MKSKIFIIMFCGILMLGIGTSVAYYNTKSFGFDENAKIFSREKDKISFLDFEIYFEDVDDFFERAGKYVPENIATL